MRREWIEIFLSSSCCLRLVLSPSMRREWIEIQIRQMVVMLSRSSPSMRREWIEMIASGASLIGMASPSMRREWIEMGSRSRLRTGDRVSLHAEGVD